jgi:branched-chain amino acid transport system substrate-binding protein
MRLPCPLKIASAVAGAALLAAACSSSHSATATKSAPDGGATAAPTTPAAASNDWALKYTGGTAGLTNPSLDPIVIGYVNQEGGVPAFPEATAGTEAAVEYINKELGGIGGHQLKLKKCLVQSEEDGQKCGTELVNDPTIKAVLTGTLTTGGDSLYKVIASRLPVVVGNPVSNPDFLTKGIAAFTPGSPGVIQGLGVFVARNLSTPDKPIKKVAVVYGDNDGAKAAVNVLFNPVLKKLGVTNIKAVPVADTATGPDVQAAVQAAGAGDADVLVPLVTQQGCIATYDALKALGITPSVVTTGLCLGTQMTQHLKDVGDKGQVPERWYFGSYGYSYFLPDQPSGMATYVAKVKQYGGPNVEYTGFAGPQFANVMTIAKFLNAIGPDKITADLIKAQVQSFAGPMMMTAGPMACGKVSPVFQSLCGAEMGIEQYLNGKWVPIADALNGKAINPGEVLAKS